MINKILSCFNIINIEAEIENFSRYYFKASATKGEVDLDNEVYKELKNYFERYGYRWSFSIEDESYHIDQNNFQELIISNTFSDTFEISLEIFKEGDTILILDENIFFSFLENLALQDLLMHFTNKEACVFQNPEYKNTISSSFIGYNQQVSFSRNSIKLSSQCYFYNYANFKFSPNSFCFQSDDSQNDRLLNLFKKVYFVMILIYLFDISEIKDDKILFKVKGNKIFNYELEFKNIDISSLTEYEKIYNWVYSDNNKVEDKIGIVRNIITFYLEPGAPTINTIVYKSILNANELYIKGNVTKYLESRSKIFDQLEGITNKISSSLDTFFSNFQKSIYVFISFYLTVFILKILNNKSDITSALSKEATITGLALICISIGFLIFSLIIINLDKNRIIQKYDNLKERFLDILDSQDILKILNNDKEFNSELANFKKRRNGYTILWIITIIILCTSLLLTSEWIRFNNKEKSNNKSEINKYPTILKRDKVLIINSKTKT